MTDLRSRILATGAPVAQIAEEAKSLTRGHLSNVMYGRRRLSPEAEARVAAVLERLERRAQIDAASRVFGRTTIKEILNAR